MSIILSSPSALKFHVKRAKIYCAKCNQCKHTLSYPSGLRIHERGGHTYRAKLLEAFASPVLIFPTQVLDASKNCKILHIQVSC